MISLEKIEKLQTLWGLPEVLAMKGQMQNEWHEFDVYRHTQEVYTTLNERGAQDYLLAAAVLHDIGKVPTARIDRDKAGNIEYVNGHISYSFTGHEKKGKEMVNKMPESLFSRIGLDKDKIADIVGNHYIIMPGCKKIKRAKTLDKLRNYIEEVKSELDSLSHIKEDLIELFYADLMGKGFYNKPRREVEFAVYETLANKINLDSLYSEVKKQRSMN